MNETPVENAEKEPVSSPQPRSATPLYIVAVGLILMIAIVAYGMSKGGGIKAVPGTPATSGAPAAADRVIANVDGTPIYESEFNAAMESVPENARAAVATPQGKWRLMDELVRLKIMQREAEKLGVQNRPDVKAQMSLSSGNILASAAVTELLRKGQPSSLQQLYEKNKAEFETVKARQIVIAYQGGLVPAKSGKSLTDEEARAKAGAVVVKLRSGADFAAVAKQESDEPSVAQTGGSIGEVSHKSLPPEIDKVLFSLSVNQISDPVKSRYGYHVFQVTGKQSKSFEEVKPFLQQQSENLRARDIIESARAKAKVEFVDPSFAPPAGAQQPPAVQ